MARDGDIETPLWKRESEDFVGEIKFHNYTAKPPSGGMAPETQGPQFRFFDRWPRIQRFAKHLHWISIIIYLCLIIYAEFSSLNGVRHLIPNHPVAHVSWFGAILFVFSVLLLFSIAVIFGKLFANKDNNFMDILKDFIGTGIFYTGLGILLLGTFVSVMVVGFRSGGKINTNIIHISGFFCLLYLGGPLTYDGMIRTQRLFDNIETLEIIETTSEVNDACSTADISTNQSVDSVSEWLEEFGAKPFDNTSVMLVIAILFVVPFSIIWYIRSGPFNTGSPWTLFLVTVFDVLIVTLTIHFIVLVRILHSILTSSQNAPLQIVYKPFHPDSAAGFRDLGRFATRVNVLLLLGGLYLIYRLFVQGRLAVLTNSPSFKLTALDIPWMINYVLPVIVYLFVIFVWFYFSFYIIHRAMKRGKEHRLGEIETREYSDTRKYDEWNAIKSGPIWPINDRLIIALLSADLVSLAIAITAILQ